MSTRRRRSLLFLVTLMVSGGLLLIGQPMSAKEAKSSKEFHVRLAPPEDKMALTAPSAPPSSDLPLPKKRPKVHRSIVKEKRAVSEAPPRHRHREVLSSDQLLVVAVDVRGREVARTLILDPRLVRAETFDPSSGENLSSEVAYRSDVEFTVTFPDDPDIRFIRFYHPSWIGKEFTLELIGETEVQ